MPIQVIKNQNILHPDCVIEQYIEIGGVAGILLLEERENRRQFARGEKLERVLIEGLKPNDTIVFSLDVQNLGRGSNYINRAVPNVTKGCDAVIITKIEEEEVKQIYIFLCDLKTERKSGLEAKMLSSEAFLIYIEALLQRFYQKNFQKAKIAFVVFSKRGTKGNRPRTDKPYSIKNKHYQNGIIKIVEVQSNARRGIRIHINELIERAHFEIHPRI